MSSFLALYWPTLITIVISSTAFIVSILSWRKSRAIYSIETMTLREVRGRNDDEVIEKRLIEIKNKLNSGKYTILNITNRSVDNDFQIFLGKIKK